MLICSVKCAHPSFTSGSALTVGYNYGLPLSHLLLARQLEGLTTLRKRSVLCDDRLKKTRLAIDWSMAVALPVIGILLHLTQQVSHASPLRSTVLTMLTLQERRFYIMEGAGCTPATYWNAWGVLAMAFFPIAIAVGAMIYTGESHRQQRRPRQC
jgi:pheromone a factor receptor